ncbi:hypothetical protein OIU76_009799 [Salix suchowensis]|nr:hypothetical protein OIU76_009799 [Salix suchowensis]
MAVAEVARGDNSSSHILRSSSLTLDTSLSLPDLTPPLIELCKDLFKKWSELDDSSFSVETVSGGITNLLLKVSVKEEDGNEVSVTVRLFGPNTDYVINRERELQAIKYLSAAGFGAKLLGVFQNGMVQSFINARTLIPQDMREPKLAAEIAKQLHKFHQVDIPGSKEPQLWNDIFRFYENASILHFDDIEKQKKYETILFKEVYNEVVEIKELTDLLNAPVVFAHNDLLSGNLMLNDDEEVTDTKGIKTSYLLVVYMEKSILVGLSRIPVLNRTTANELFNLLLNLSYINLEAVDFCYRGFDIGNHFNEYGGYDCDYSLYPSKDEQYHFFRHYLQPDKPHEVSDKDLEAIFIETNTYMLVSHLFWALWALIQARMSPIDFDYLGYFFLRYNEFKRQKEKACSLARSYLSGRESW